MAHYRMYTSITGDELLEPTIIGLKLEFRQYASSVQVLEGFMGRNKVQLMYDYEKGLWYYPFESLSPVKTCWSPTVDTVLERLGKKPGFFFTRMLYLSIKRPLGRYIWVTAVVERTMDTLEYSIMAERLTDLCALIDMICRGTILPAVPYPADSAVSEPASQ